MKIKMLALDLDRTLLREDKTVSEYTLKILNECKKMGIIIAIASARPRRAAKVISKIIDCDNIVCLNGAMITADEKIIATNKIDEEVAYNLILKIVDRFPNSKVSAEIDDYIHANFDLNEFFSDTSNVIRTDFSEAFQSSVEADLVNNLRGVDKIIFGVEDAYEINEIKAMLPNGLYTSIANGFLLQIMSENATKLRGVIALAKHYNISIDEVAAFGDDYDDIAMLKECGHGVAVANAIEDVIKAADYITESSNNDGVAKWIEKNILSTGGKTIENIRN